MLRSKKKEINDSVVYMSLSYICPNVLTFLVNLIILSYRALLKDLPASQIDEIFVCDSLTSLQLVNLFIKSKDILHYFEQMKNTIQFVMLPFED